MPKRFRVQGFMRTIGRPLLVRECDTAQEALDAAKKYESENISKAIIFDEESGKAVPMAEFAATHRLR